MYDIRLAGENALIVYLGEDIDPAISQQVSSLTQAVDDAIGEFTLDLIPSYTSLLVLFDPQALTHQECKYHLQQCLNNLDTYNTKASSVIELPVCYDGMDLSTVADATGLSTANVIELHSETIYHCYAIGFAPGFAYLGQLDARLQLPRLSTPRACVPAGSVAIAGQQTAVYPSNSPGGWHIIGRCPQALFDRRNTPPCPITVGDQVRFIPITASAYEAFPR